MMGIKLEKLAQSQSSECCNADFLSGSFARFVLKSQSVSVKQS